MGWVKYWIKLGCDKKHCMRHDYTWENSERNPERSPPGGICPECKALGLKGAEWEPEPGQPNPPE